MTVTKPRRRGRRRWFRDLALAFASGAPTHRRAIP